MMYDVLFLLCSCTYVHDLNNKQIDNTRIVWGLHMWFNEINVFSARCVRRTNRRAIATMFVRLPVRPSVCLSGTSVHCDHAVHFSADLSLRLNTSMLWAP